MPIVKEMSNDAFRSSHANDIQVITDILRYQAEFNDDIMELSFDQSEAINRSIDAISCIANKIDDDLRNLKTFSIINSITIIALCLIVATMLTIA